MKPTDCICNTVPRRMKGRNLPLEWSIVDKRTGEPVNLEDKSDLKVQIIKPDGKVYEVSLISVKGNVITFSYPGPKQTTLGIHSLKMWYDYGKDTQDGCTLREAFELVEWTEEEAN